MQSRKKLATAALSTAALSVAAVLVCGASPQAVVSPQNTQQFYLGFDRNIYPGDDALPILRKTFSFAGYWLSPPPGEKKNTWSAKRKLLHSLDFGFLVLYRGRDSHEFKNAQHATRLGEQDAVATAEAAKREGFPRATVIFLDIEEGGRLSPAYHSYIQGWLRILTERDYQGGFYCSGMPVKEDARRTITTADDITSDLFFRSRAFSIWAYNDACPPSPGCTFPVSPPAPSASGIEGATVWQFAQSPRRREFTAHCPSKYSPDGNCYALNDTARKWFLDVNSATSPDPSGGAK